MEKSIMLTEDDINRFKMPTEEAIDWFKYYATRYKSKEHYEHLGASYVMSIIGTVNTITKSARYLNGVFIMPDEINVEKVSNWIMEEHNFMCDHDIVTFFMADFIKKK